MADVWPDAWLDRDAKELVISFLRDKVADVRRRKFAYYEWAKWAGVPVTAEDVERVTGRPAGEV